ncbi:MAG: hypothetical protein FXF47_10020 [Candidatus Mcinerneyibacterium aminivorans]|uniref:4Fe-4S dicluster domain-containing protein n=1 Tax=Candidatus Mcinerneyibacterium aminivorans TaxID=2703815 RepID=A0A5D0MD50_9BACT|nr:MAG: hypothetical protein FXF47_10020 [Candidatus Mcinerneyibacterium aminivorans]
MDKNKKIIKVDENKCINCQACIKECPVKICNEVSNDHVTVNNDLCLACGACIDVCKQNARKGIDDIDKLKEVFNNPEKKAVAVISPTIASNFPGSYLKINTFLKENNFDLCINSSVGAEIAAKTYKEKLDNSNANTILTANCPSIVTYVEKYKPELKSYLINSASPIIHTVRMIRNYKIKYKNAEFFAFTPCYSKSKEFEELDENINNITFRSLKNFWQNNNIDINKFEKSKYDYDTVNKGAFYPLPDGMKDILNFHYPEFDGKYRGVNGKENIYDYLDKLPESILKNVAPDIVNCQNCKNGCNLGHGTLNRLDKNNKPVDVIEIEASKLHEEIKSNENTVKSLKKKYWKKELYHRDFHEYDNIYWKEPTEQELQNIYNKMNKFSSKDIYDCGACGYETCQDMARAIFNDVNKPKNCHHYHKLKLKRENKKDKKYISKLSKAHDNFMEKLQKDSENLYISVSDLIDEIHDDNDELKKELKNILVKYNISEEMIILIRRFGKNYTDTIKKIQKQLRHMQDKSLIIRKSINKVTDMKEE